MGDSGFTGKFLTPTPGVSVQHLDPTHLNRLSADIFLWAMAAVGVVLAIHFVFLALPDLLRRKDATAEDATSMKNAQFKRRTAVQIVYHWINFAAITGLILSGLAIFFGLPGTDDFFTWHLWIVWIFLAALAFHIWYDTFRFKNFHRMWVTRQDISDAMSRLSRAENKPAPKHGFYKVEQIVYHWILTVIVLGLVITGFIIWNPGRMFVAPFWMPWGWDAIFVARDLHNIFTFLLVAIILGHIYFAVLVPKNWPVLKSIFTGRALLSWYLKHHKVSSQFESRVKEMEAAQKPGAPRTGMEQRQQG